MLDFKFQVLNSKSLWRLFFLLLFFSFLLVFHSQAVATNCPTTDYDCQINEIQKEIDTLTPAHEKNKEELKNLNIQLSSLGKRISVISKSLENVEKDIMGREEDLAFAQKIVEEKAENHYRFIRLYDPFVSFISSKNASEAFKEINFRQRTIDEDRKVMEKYANDLLELKKDKEVFKKNNLHKDLEFKTWNLKSNINLL